MRPSASVLGLVLAVSPFLLPSHARADWQWLYPMPQGHTLNDVTFLTPSVAVAVGDAGTILVSTDAGLTWTATTKVNGIETALNHVARLDDTSAIAVGDNGVVIKTVNLSSGWVPEDSGTQENLYSVDVNGLTGLAVGGTTAVLTTDGGDTWSPITIPSLDMRAVAVASPTAWFVTDYNLGLLKTDNAGANWTLAVITPYSQTVSFTDALNGAFASLGALQVTDDGGATWTPYPIDPGQSETGMAVTDLAFDPQDVAFSALTTICDVYNPGRCSSYGEAHASTNGLASWSIEQTSPPLRGVAVNTNGVRLFVGDGGAVCRWAPPDPLAQVAGASDESLDGGKSSFVDATTGVAVGWHIDDPYAPYDRYDYSVILRTSDGGDTWHSVSAGGILYDVAFAPSSGPTHHAYSVGVRYDVPTSATQAIIMESPDDGAAWSTIWSDATIAPLRAVSFASETRGAAVGMSGTVVMIDNGIVTPSTVAPGANLMGVAFADPLVGVAVGGMGPSNARVAAIVRTTNGGTTWPAVTLDVAEWLAGVAFADAQTGIAVGSHGTILRSVDDGGVWDPVTSPVSVDLNAVAFENATHGFIVGAHGIVLETSNGGSSWDPVVSPTTVDLADVQPFSTCAVVTGPGETILLYETSAPTAIVSAPPAASAELLPNVPNPFNPVTTLRYVVASRGRVTLSVYDVAGHHVATLVDDVVSAGRHEIEWNGTDAKGNAVASGVYVSRLRIGTTSLSRTMVLLK